MPRVVFTPNLQRHVDCPETESDGKNVGEVLETIFQSNPMLRGYVIDEQGRLRTHMAVFINGVPLKDREQLSDGVSAESEIYVMQALSGG